MTAVPGQPEAWGTPESDRMVSAPDAISRLRCSRPSFMTLLRKGQVPGISRGKGPGTRWGVPESFIRMVLYAPRDGHPRSLEDVAKRWFAIAGARYAQAEAMIAPDTMLTSARLPAARVSLEQPAAGGTMRAGIPLEQGRTGPGSQASLQPARDPAEVPGGAA